MLYTQGAELFRLRVGTLGGVSFAQKCCIWIGAIRLHHNPAHAFTGRNDFQKGYGGIVYRALGADSRLMVISLTGPTALGLRHLHFLLEYIVSGGFSAGGEGKAIVFRNRELRVYNADRSQHWSMETGTVQENQAHLICLMWCFVTWARRASDRKEGLIIGVSFGTWHENHIAKGRLGCY